MTGLHQPHALIVRLHVRKSNVLILTPELHSQLVFEQWPIHVGRLFHPGQSHGCCPVRATGGSLPCGRHLLATLNGNKEGSRCLMVLRVKPTPTRFPTNSLYTPVDKHTLAFCIKCVPPVGRVLLLFRLHQELNHSRKAPGFFN